MQFFSQIYFRRLSDLIHGLCCGICLIPLLPIIGLIIKLDSPGPIFFKTTRRNIYGRKSNIFVFRYMYTDAEARIKLRNDKIKTNNNNDPMKLEHDPRITRVGRFLIKAKLHELPMAFFVLIGDASYFIPSSKNSPIFTLVINSLLLRRFLLLFGYISFVIVYDHLSRQANIYIQCIMLFLAIGLIFDIILIVFRYKKRRYGQSMQEIGELYEFLSAKYRRKNDGISGGNSDKVRLYPDVVEIEDVAPFGVPEELT